jgi:hypothetical protein
MSWRMSRMRFDHLGADAEQGGDGHLRPARRPGQQTTSTATATSRSRQPEHPRQHRPPALSASRGDTGQRTPVRHAQLTKLARAKAERDRQDEQCFEPPAGVSVGVEAEFRAAEAAGGLG